MRTDKMRFDHIRPLRSISAEVFRVATLTGASRRDVTAQLIEKALEIPGFQFVANNNVRWSNQAYFKMLVRTELMNAGRDAYSQKCAEEGYDLVMLTTFCLFSRIDNLSFDISLQSKTCDRRV